MELKEDKVDYEKINETRYTDWAITTPIMLLVLVLALLYNSNGGKLKFSSFLLILFFNYGMLASGYLGEQGVIEKMPANIIGFVFFAALYYYIYATYIQNNYNFDNMILF